MDFQVINLALEFRSTGSDLQSQIITNIKRMQMTDLHEVGNWRLFRGWYVMYVDGVIDPGTLTADDLVHCVYGSAWI